MPTRLVEMAIDLHVQVSALKKALKKRFTEKGYSKDTKLTAEEIKYLKETFKEDAEIAQISKSINIGKEYKQLTTKSLERVTTDIEFLKESMNQYNDRINRAIQKVIEMLEERKGNIETLIDSISKSDAYKEPKYVIRSVNTSMFEISPEEEIMRAIINGSGDLIGL